MLPGPEKGAEPNYKNPRVEPADHGLGHSRGGWSTKSHVAVDPSGDHLLRDLDRSVGVDRIL